MSFLVYVLYRICHFHLRKKINFSKKEVFQKNGCPTLFTDECFKDFLGRLHIIKPTLATKEKNLLRLVLPYLGPISEQK